MSPDAALVGIVLPVAAAIAPAPGAAQTPTPSVLPTAATPIPWDAAVLPLCAGGVSSSIPHAFPIATWTAVRP